MIRFGFAYCACCYHKLGYNKLADYFWCECRGWAKLSWAERERELKSAATWDKRANPVNTIYGVQDGN